MYEKDRAFVLAQVLRVMADWGVTPGPRGSGVGDFEYWTDAIVNAKGWEPYWEESRMPRAFEEAGYHKVGTSTPPPPVVQPPPNDPYMVKLNAIHADVQTLVSGLRSYFR